MPSSPLGPQPQRFSELPGGLQGTGADWLLRHWFRSLTRRIHLSALPAAIAAALPCSPVERLGSGFFPSLALQA